MVNERQNTCNQRIAPCVMLENYFTNIFEFSSESDTLFVKLMHFEFSQKNLM